MDYLRDLKISLKREEAYNESKDGCSNWEETYYYRSQSFLPQQKIRVCLLLFVNNNIIESLSSKAGTFVVIATWLVRLPEAVCSTLMQKNDKIITCKDRGKSDSPFFFDNKSNYLYK